jgi:hypothetical protein
MDLNENCRSRTQGSENSIGERAETDRVSNSRGQGESLLIFFPEALWFKKSVQVETRHRMGGMRGNK